MVSGEFVGHVKPRGGGSNLTPTVKGVTFGYVFKRIVRSVKREVKKKYLSQLICEVKILYVIRCEVKNTSQFLR